MCNWKGLIHFHATTNKQTYDWTRKCTKWQHSSQITTLLLTCWRAKRPWWGFFSAELRAMEDTLRSCRLCLHKVYCQTLVACNTPSSAAVWCCSGFLCSISTENCKHRCTLSHSHRTVIHSFKPVSSVIQSTVKRKNHSMKMQLMKHLAESVTSDENILRISLTRKLQTHIRWCSQWQIWTKFLMLACDRGI